MFEGYFARAREIVPEEESLGLEEWSNDSNLEADNKYFGWEKVVSVSIENNSVDGRTPWRAATRRHDLLWLRGGGGAGRTAPSQWEWL